jgi:hypothetical protein
MKKAIAILLIPVFLLATSAGVAMSSHYCKGALKKIGFSVEACCKDVNKGGCCKTTPEIIKVKDHFLKASADLLPDAFFVITPAVIFPYSEVYIVTENKNLSGLPNGPPTSGRPLYIQYSSLLI